MEQMSSCAAERNDLGNLGRGSPNDHSCEVPSKSAKQLRRRCRLKVFFSIFSPGRKLVQQSGTISAILVEGQPTIIPVKFHQNQPSGYGGEVV